MKIDCKRLPPTVSDEIIMEILRMHNWKSARRAASILMVDIRGFEKISANENPLDVMDCAENMLVEIIKTAQYFEGTPSHLSGERLTLAFGVPSGMADHQRKSVLCALEIQRSLTSRKTKSPLKFKSGLGATMALASGEVWMGRVRHDKFHESCVLGEPVRLASVLLNAASQNQILATPNYAEAIMGKYYISHVSPSILEIRPFSHSS